MQKIITLATLASASALVAALIANPLPETSQQPGFACPPVGAELTLAPKDAGAEFELTQAIGAEFEVKPRAVGAEFEVAQAIGAEFEVKPRAVGAEFEVKPRAVGSEFEVKTTKVFSHATLAGP